MKTFMFAAFTMMVCLAGCCSNPPSLPDASEVKTIKVIADHGGATHFIPPDHIPAVLGLFKAGCKDNNPAKWQVMGHDLEITTADGNRINIWLFKTLHEKGAFAIGKTWEQRTYYRGSTDKDLAAIMEKAKKVQ